MIAGTGPLNLMIQIKIRPDTTDGCNVGTMIFLLMENVLYRKGCGYTSICTYILEHPLSHNNKLGYIVALNETLLPPIQAV